MDRKESASRSVCAIRGEGAKEAGLGSSTWSQVQVQLLCQVASTSTSTDLKSQVQVQVL